MERSRDLLKGQAARVTGAISGIGEAMANFPLYRLENSNFRILSCKSSGKNRRSRTPAAVLERV